MKYKLKIPKTVFFLLILVLFIFGANTANAATLYFSPSSGNFTVGNIFTVNVMVDTGDKAINNAEAAINFPPALLEVVSVGKFGSIFSLWVLEPNFSNSQGTLSFNGGLPTPGFNGSTGKILSLVFRVKKAGSASVFSSLAAVRANDGYGTDILTNSLQASFTLVPETAPAPPATEKPISDAPAAPKISSPSHPDSSKWYSESTATFTWPVESGATGARLLVDKIPNSRPTVFYSSPIAEKTIEDLEDGVWYFHVRLRNVSGWGETSHFRFQIDTKSPEHFVITFPDGKETTDPQPLVGFETTDSLSGISRYELKIADGDLLTISDLIEGKYYKLPVQTPGTRTILVRAFDKADNYTDAIDEFTILAPPKPPLVTPLRAIILLVLVLLILLILWRDSKKKRLRKEIREADESVHKSFDLLKEEVEEQIRGLEKVKSRRKLTEKENNIISQLKKDLDDAEEFIRKEIKDIDKEVR